MPTNPAPEPDALEADRKALETCEVRDRAEPGKVLFGHPKLRERILGYLDELREAREALSKIAAYKTGDQIIMGYGIDSRDDSMPDDDLGPYPFRRGAALIRDKMADIALEHIARHGGQEEAKDEND